MKIINQKMEFNSLQNELLLKNSECLSVISNQNSTINRLRKEIEDKDEIIETFKKDYKFIVNELNGLEDENKKLRHDSDSKINILRHENDSLRETVDCVNHFILFSR